MKEIKKDDVKELRAQIQAMLKKAMERPKDPENIISFKTVIDKYISLKTQSIEAMSEKLDQNTSFLQQQRLISKSEKEYKMIEEKMYKNQISLLQMSGALKVLKEINILSGGEK